jgi:acetate kinase
MDALLVVNAGSSSLKFQLFAVEGGAPVRRYRGQIDGIGVRPRLKVQDADGAPLEDRTFETAALADLPAAIAAMRAWFATLQGVRTA